MKFKVNKAVLLSIIVFGVIAALYLNYLFSLI